MTARLAPTGPASLLALALAACGDAAPTGYEPQPGGGGGGSGGGQVDAGLDAGDGGPGDGGAPVTGRACLVTDLRASTAASCAATGAGGLVVTLGDQEAVTADSGAFTIAAPTVGGSLAWRVAGAGVVASVMPAGGAGAPLIPVIDVASYDELLLGNGALPVEGEGAIVGQVVRQGAALGGAVVGVSPPPSFEPLYDGATAAMWRTDATGARGAFWIPGVAAGVATLTVTPLVQAPVTRAVPVEDQAITFVTIALP